MSGLFCVTPFRTWESLPCIAYMAIPANFQLEWARQMNACVAQAEEAIKGE